MNNVTFIDKLIEASDRTPPKPTKYVLTNSDFEIGHPELGYMRFLKASLRSDKIDWMEYEELRYQRFVLRHKGIRVSVVDGVAYVR